MCKRNIYPSNRAIVQRLSTIVEAPRAKLVSLTLPRFAPHLLRTRRARSWRKDLWANKWQHLLSELAASNPAPPRSSRHNTAPLTLTFGRCILSRRIRQLPPQSMMVRREVGVCLELFLLLLFLFIAVWCLISLAGTSTSTHTWQKR